MGSSGGYINKALISLDYHWFLALSGSWSALHAMHTESVQSYVTLCKPIGCNPQGSSVHGILQTRILEWVAISFSRGFSCPCLLHWQEGSLPLVLPEKPQESKYKPRFPSGKRSCRQARTWPVISECALTPRSTDTDVS